MIELVGLCVTLQLQSTTTHYPTCSALLLLFTKQTTFVHIAWNTNTNCSRQFPKKNSHTFVECLNDSHAASRLLF